MLNLKNLPWQNLDQELARKVALQTQMLEQERQREALEYQQSLLLQQQQQVSAQSSGILNIYVSRQYYC